MFTGTLRFNLDPEEKASNAEIEDLLRRAGLDAVLDADSKGLEQEITENG